MKVKLTVALNGTKVNPFEKLGVRCNPFPQIADYEHSTHCLRVQELGGDPIPNQAYIREKLKGFSPAFIDLCCQTYTKGKYVKFTVEWNE
jgi:hypothetical protein